MTDIIWHDHHVIPLHMDGPDEKSNLLKCNIACHAFLHKCLYEEHGNEYDRIAWLCLSGQITNAEANIMATKLANTGKSPWNKGLIGVQKSTRRGKARSEEEKKRISEGTKKGMAKGKPAGRPKGIPAWNKGLKLGPGRTSPNTSAQSLDTQ